jgi:hypothetical protein
MEPSPSWETSSCLATQEFLNILLNPIFQYRVHMGPPLVPILSQPNPIHTTPSYFSKIYFNIIFPLRLDLPSGAPTKTVYASFMKYVWMTKTPNPESEIQFFLG